MRNARIWLDAGSERVLDVAQAYDLPDVVARVFIAAGDAVVLEEVASRPPEGRPRRAPETKRS